MSAHPKIYPPNTNLQPKHRSRNHKRLQIKLPYRQFFFEHGQSRFLYPVLFLQSCIPLCIQILNCPHIGSNQNYFLAPSPSRTPKKDPRYSCCPVDIIFVQKRSHHRKKLRRFIRLARHIGISPPQPFVVYC